MQLIDKEEVVKSKRSRAKSKNNRYDRMRDKALKLVPWMYKKMSDDCSREVDVEAREVAKELGLADKSNATIYTGLRYLLFFEGINVSMKYDGKADHIIMRPISGFGHGLSDTTLKTFDNMELDGWYIKRQDRDGMCFKHSIRKSANKDQGGNDTYVLESDGSIYFDRRDLTEAQALEFAKYMSSKDMRAPDLVYLTPINVVIPEDYTEYRRDRVDIDFDKVGREFRIVKSGGSESEFIVTSIYGKECIMYEHDIDDMIKGCSVYRILHNIDQALMIEKTPERIEILKRILPDIMAKTKHTAAIKDHMLIVVNSAGTFHLSIVDGTLHKIYGERKDWRKDGSNKQDSKYVCVGARGFVENYVIFDGTKYKIDGTMGTILSKAIMLLEEKYPDERTRSQVVN